jgi:hypothetical protein
VYLKLWRAEILNLNLSVYALQSTNIIVLDLQMNKSAQNINELYLPYSVYVHSWTFRSWYNFFPFKYIIIIIIIIIII